MNHLCFIFFCVSLLVLLSGFIASFTLYGRKKIALRGLIHRLVISAALSATIIFFPLFCGENTNTFNKIFVGIFSSVQAAVKMFFGDFDISGILQRFGKIGVNKANLNLLSPLFALISVIAPLLTISYVVNYAYSLVIHLKTEWFCFNKNIYIFNELNMMSATLSQNIYDNHGRKNCLFIFCDVFSQENEESYELSEKIRKIGGVCYKQDVLSIDKKFHDRYHRFSDKETAYFLISTDEKENISHAINLSQVKYKKDSRVKIYVFSSKDHDGCILDSLVEIPEYDLENSYIENFANQIKVNSSEQMALAHKFINQNVHSLFTEFQSTMPVIIKRINPVQRLVWRTLSNKKYFLYKKGSKKLSILIAGMGDYGFEFLKTLVWFYQLPDCRLEINILDKDPNIIDKIKGSCPELINCGQAENATDTNYRINFYAGTDITGYSFEELIKDNESLKNTDAAFICLGEDSLNTTAAMRVRSLLKRYNSENDSKIFSIVHDDNHAEKLHSRLISPEKEDYNITFIGGIASLYEYKSITNYCYENENQNTSEEEAFLYHMQWLLIEHYENSKKSNPETDNAELVKKVLEKLTDYINFEYYRHSSMAMSMHKRMLRDNFPQYFPAEQSDFVSEVSREHKINCNCKICKARKQLEHDRWQTYMRANGFVYGKKNILAKTHKDLIDFSSLADDHKLKDN